MSTDVVNPLVAAGGSAKPQGSTGPRAAVQRFDGIVVAPSVDHTPSPSVAKRLAGPATVQGRAPWKRWLAWATASAAFFFAAFSRVAPSGLINGLKDDFGVTGALLGTLGAEYYYLYVACQVPIGVAITRFGVRKVLIAFCVINLAGTALFSLAPALWALHAGRVLIGLGSSATFVSFVTVIKQWFPPDWAGLLMGLSLTIGVTGASLGQSALTTLAAAIGWRQATLSAASVLLVVIAVAVTLMDDFGPNVGHSPGEDAVATTVARNARSGGGRQASADAQQAREQGHALPPGSRRGSRDTATELTTWEQWVMVRGTGQVWVAALVGCLLNVCIMSFNGLWATPFLKVKYGLSTSQAGLISSAGFWGNAVASPIVGAWGDRVHAKRTILFASLFLQCVASSLLIFVDGTSPVVGGILSFCIGAGTNINVLLATVRKFMRSAGVERTIALAGGVMTASFLASPIIVQPVVGALLDAQRTGGQVSTNEHFKLALCIFPISAGLGCIAVLFLRTSHAGMEELRRANQARLLALVGQQRKSWSQSSEQARV